MPKQLSDVVARALRIAPDLVVDGLEFQSIPEWDSIGHASLMIEIEEAYGVKVADDQVVELTTLDAIRTFVSNLPRDGRAGA